MSSQNVLTTDHERVHIPVGPRLLWRYLVTGATIRGHGDNASFLQGATVDYRGKPVPRYSAARWRRVARRNAAVTVPLLLLAGAPWATLWPFLCYVVAIPLATVGYGAHRMARALRMRRLYREWIDPATEVACRVLGIAYRRRRARAMLELPLTWGAGSEDSAPSVARLLLPAGTALSDGVKRQVVSNVGGRLGIPRPSGTWNEAGSVPFVDIAGTPSPPADVTYASLAKAIGAAAEDEVVLGRAAGEHIVKMSLSGDDPHMLVSGKSGTGKSVLLRVFLRQRIERGDGVIMTDPKRFSHIRWAGKLPTSLVVYAYRDVDLHNTWLAVAAETRRRIELPEDELAMQRRVFIVAEELNAQIKKIGRAHV